MESIYLTRDISFVSISVMKFAHPLIDSTGRTNSFFPYKNLKKLGLKNNIFIFIAFAIFDSGLNCIFYVSS